MNPAAIHIRPATVSDGEAWLSLIDALADYEKLPRPDAAARQRLLVDAFGERPRTEVTLAEFEGRVVGYAITFCTYSSFLALPTLYLEDLFVLESHRGQGAGYRLFTHCVEEAHRRGCGRMEWQVLDWNRPAIEFYEKLGAKQLKEWLSYRLVREDLEALLMGKAAGQASA
ncbi:MAG: GNAT family N-acetyltransferase [Acidobacteria bacterium]|nr:GNAT family N-acetyltransferase [Acidobacteriota bacterium]MCI0624425.1 GNAT family N-acetyltransferase [Acidobacteriota bacterium]MCI0720814.1 GNAT family N-acetyltransferase [Acidobacteriota bacterium]